MLRGAGGKARSSARAHAVSATGLAVLLLGVVGLPEAGSEFVRGPEFDSESQTAPRAEDTNPTPARTIHDLRRTRMVEEQLKARDIDNPRVLQAMQRVPRHLFVAPEQRPMAYDDRPLPIPEGQTISQPYIVALMTQLADPQPGDRALDVGTGSGYQAAVLAELVERVHGIEIHKSLADEARGRLERLGYDNVEVRHGDGYRGWPEHAPFDVIILAAAPPVVPPELVAQLAPGGRLVLPVGDLGSQELVVIEKQADGSATRRRVIPVAFVPMTGEVQGSEDRP